MQFQKVTIVEFRFKKSHLKVGPPDYENDKMIFCNSLFR